MCLNCRNYRMDKNMNNQPILNIERFIDISQSSVQTLCISVCCFVIFLILLLLFLFMRRGLLISSQF